MRLPLRSLAYFALGASLLAGCSASVGTPPANVSAASAQARQGVSDARAVRRHFRLVSPLESEFVRTGVLLWSASAVCANEHVPQRLSDLAFPLDAATLQPPRSATVRVQIDAIQACSQTGHAPNAQSTVLPMNVATLPPSPGPTPSFGGDGYYVVALAADAGGRTSVLDVSGPLDRPADGPFAFGNGSVQLSSDSTYAFYLAKLRTTPEDDEAF